MLYSSQATKKIDQTSMMPLSEKQTPTGRKAKKVINDQLFKSLLGWEGKVLAKGQKLIHLESSLCYEACMISQDVAVYFFRN